MPDIQNVKSNTLVPYLYRCPEKLQGILFTDANGDYYFVFGDKCISLNMLKVLIEK